MSRGTFLTKGDKTVPFRYCDYVSIDFGFQFSLVFPNFYKKIKINKKTLTFLVMYFRF